MHDAEKELRRLLDDSEKPLKHIAAEAGVGYHRLHRWFTKRTIRLGYNDGARLQKLLTGKP